MRSLFTLLLGLLLALPAGAQSPAPAAPTAPVQRVSLDDLYAPVKLPDMAISPSGRYLATIVQVDAVAAVIVWDLETGKYQNIASVPKDAVAKNTEARPIAVYWKSEDRILFRLSVRPRDGVSIGAFGGSRIAMLGDRIFAVNRDGSDVVRLLGDNRNAALAGALNLGSIASFLPRDPDHIMMTVDGFDGRSLFRANVRTGLGEIVEPPVASVIGWWLDVDGKPVVRVEYSSGTYRLRRKEADGKWKVFYRVRARELEERPDYAAVGPSDVAGEYYVLARPEDRDRMGLYRYDITQEKFGEPIYEHPKYDLVSADISRDGKRVLRHCHIDHVLVCQFADPTIEAHMRGVRKFFDDSANVHVFDASEDQKVLILYVEGPHDAPSFHRYRIDSRQVENLGPVRETMLNRLMPRASVVEWKARDGVALQGYLTRSPGAENAKSLPLVVYPHGGPEQRDSLSFDPWVQYLAARGYAVLQPNFRGSAGFGRSFAELGYGQWGRAMQDDVTDAVRHLVEQGSVDPKRICIVGASYGGYAALAGAALTPELYRCAVSIAGVADLAEFIGWRKRKWGADSESYTYWLQSIGDPDRDAAKLAATSPARLAAAVRIPVLLIHGEEDDIVPVSQSVAMKKALDKAGRSTELMRIPGEGHSRWSDDNEKLALIAIDRFLWEHLGPGHEITAAPPPLPTRK
jgi:dipeptidyl aminopeptidase/acylaminoacyl peptidase